VIDRCNLVLLNKRHGVDECVEQSDGVFMGARKAMNVAIAAVPGCAEDAEDSEEILVAEIAGG